MLTLVPILYCQLSPTEMPTLVPIYLFYSWLSCGHSLCCVPSADQDLKKKLFCGIIYQNRLKMTKNHAFWWLFYPKVPNTFWPPYLAQCALTKIWKNPFLWHNLSNLDWKWLKNHAFWWFFYPKVLNTFWPPYLAHCALTEIWKKCFFVI